MRCRTDAAFGCSGWSHVNPPDGFPNFDTLQLEFVYNNAGYIAATQPVQYNSQFTGESPPPQPQTYYKPPGSSPQHLCSQMPTAISSTGLSHLCCIARFRHY